MSIVCSWCGKLLVTEVEKQRRYHEGQCSEQKGRQLRIAKDGHLDRIKQKPVERLCAWCGKSLPKNSPSAKKYHDENCRNRGYAETNARNQRSYRFRREMGWAKKS